ncbi:hypothetical protein [Nocardia gipuzkoensis]
MTSPVPLLSDLTRELYELQTRTIDEIFLSDRTKQPLPLTNLSLVIVKLYPEASANNAAMIAAIKTGLKAAIELLPSTRLLGTSKDSGVTVQDAALILYGLYPFSRRDEIEMEGYEGYYQKYARWSNLLRLRCGFPAESGPYRDRRTDIRKKLARILVDAYQAGGVDKLKEQLTTPRDAADAAVQLLSGIAGPADGNLPTVIESSTEDSEASASSDQTERITEMDDEETESPNSTAKDRAKFVVEGDVTHNVTGVFAPAYGPFGGDVIHHHYSASPPPHHPRRRSDPPEANTQ